MARRTQSSKNRETDVEVGEVDAFHANREKILLDEAAEYARQASSDEESDEEVMGIDENSEDSDEEEGNEEGDSEEDDDIYGENEEEEAQEESGWGGKKNYYGGDEVSDEEDAKEITEEALKQQKRHLQQLAMADYVDEDMMENWKKAAESSVETKSTTQLNISTAELDDSERLELLHQTYPEFVPLVQELHSLKPRLVELQSKKSNELLTVKSVALSAYLASITSYFGIFIDNLKTGETFTMKDNPVMETILSSREIWRQANELPEVGVVRRSVQAEEEYDEEIIPEFEDDYDEDDESEESESIDDEQFVDAKESQDDFDIDINTSRHIKRATNNSTNSNDFTETAQPDDVDREEKQRRKKTLRFYTSKIDQSSTKNNERFSGDLDLPYRERLFERQQRLIEEARKRGLGLDKNQLGEDLDTNDMDFDEEQLAQSINHGQDDAYYNSLKNSKQVKKQVRIQAHEAAVKAAKDGKLAELQESVGEDGKRAINYQILKNKGLTPHRKKEYRNSRVKKRKQYETAQKKLKSVRQVYDANNRGPYQGEKTGIKKGISRSVKLV
ncbi:disrupter of silencing SAS10 part of small subunit processosome something about silencing 10 [Scheffersomyces amazonensis]|uniref:disrupter of silencing SAS10 part of small subunit processosome something about silencing 10 n=1 Tax=Scheffersomyces amazonensis TaxID=1078765 RepID=UPI00315D99D7